MDIESIFDGIIFVILLSAVFVYFIDLILYAVLKRLPEHQSFLFYSTILFEGSIIFILLALRYLLSFYRFSTYDNLFMAIILFFVSFLSIKLGVSYYKKSKNKNSENLEVDNKYVK